MNNRKHELDRAGDDVAPTNPVEAPRPPGKAHWPKKAQATGDRKPGKPQSAARSSSVKPGKSKKDQLVALLSKPNGARISVIVERLGWQAHTVRAALSGLRKQGFEIATSKSVKTGETVYAIVAQPDGESGQTEGAAS